MSIPLGGFHFNIGFQTPGARAAMAELRRDAAQTAAAVKAAFAGVSTGVNTSQTVAAINQVTQAAKAAQAAGRVNMVFRSEGARVAQRAAEDLDQVMTSLAGKRVSLQVNLAGNATDQTLSSIERRLDNLTRGQRFTINLRMAAEQGEQVMNRFAARIKAAEQRGANIVIKVDDKDAVRAAANAGNAAVKAARDAANEQKRITQELLRYEERAHKESERAKADAARDARRTTQELLRVNNREQRRQEQLETRINLQFDAAKAAKNDMVELIKLANQLGQVSIQIKVNSDAASQTRQLAELRKVLKEVKDGGHVALEIDGDPKQAMAKLRAMRADFAAAAARGVTVTINANTAPATRAMEALKGLAGGILRGLIAGSGVGGGLLIGAGLATGATLALGAAIAVQKLTEATIEGVKAGLEYNMMLELATEAFKQFTGGSQTAAVALQGLRRYADITPFNTKEVIASGQAFALVSAGNIKFLQRQVELAGQLAATNPAQGLEGATRAIRELQAGQVESIAERFNVPRSTIQALKDAGLAGEALTRAVVKAAGGSAELVKAYGETFSGRLSTATSNLEEFQRVLAEPVAAVLSAGLKEINADFEKNKAAYQDGARSLGEFIAIGVRGFVGFVAGLQEIVKSAGAARRELKFLADSVRDPFNARREEVQKPPEVKLTPEQEANQRASDLQIEAITRAQTELAKQQRALKDIEQSQSRINLLIAVTRQQYEKLAAPLQAQKRILEDQAAAVEANLINIAEMERKGQGPIQARAENAAQKFELDREKELLDLRQRRAEIYQELAEREAQAADRITEAAIRAAKAQLDALRDVIAAQQAARREAIDGMRERASAEKEVRDAALESAREQVRAQQEVRQAAMEALRERIRLLQEARQLELEGAREAIRVRREQYDDAIRGARELADAAERTWQREEAAADRAHKRVQEAFRRQIEQLQQRDTALRRQEQGDTPAERELKALDEQTRALAAARSLAEANNAIREARTGRERREAIARRNELLEQQAIERRRAELQAQAERERAAREEAQQARQDQIAQLQAKAQEEDRKYQQEKEARELAHQQAREQYEEQVRAEDRAERARQREEDAQIRALEKADRDQKKIEDEQIRQQEKADREAQKAEEAAIRAIEQANRAADRASQEQIAAAERADRAATRAEQEQVRSAEAALAQQERALKEAQEQRQAAAEVRRNAALNVAAGLELQIIANREQAILLQDAALLKQATYYRTLFTDTQQAINNAVAYINVQLGVIQRAGETAAAPYIQMQTALDIQKQTQDAIVKRADDRVKYEEKTLGFLGDQAKQLAAQAESARQLAENTQKVQEALRQGQTDPRTGLAQVPNTGAPPPVSNYEAFFSQNNPFTKWMLDFGVEAAKFLARSNQLGADIIAGVTKMISDDTTFLGAISSWAASGVQALRDIWEWASPSGVTMRLAADIIQGFLDGWNERAGELEVAVQAPFESLLAPDAGYFAQMPGIFGTYAIDAGQAWIDEFGNMGIVEATEQPFIDVTDVYFPAMVPKFGAAGTDAGAAYKAAWDLVPLVATMKAPFDQFLLTEMPLYHTQFTAEGQTAARLWGEAFSISDWWAVSAQNGMNVVKGSLNSIAPSFTEFGRSAGQHWGNGFIQAMNEAIAQARQVQQTQPAQPSNPSVGSPQTGGGGGGTAGRCPPGYTYNAGYNVCWKNNPDGTQTVIPANGVGNPGQSTIGAMSMSARSAAPPPVGSMLPESLRSSSQVVAARSTDVGTAQRLGDFNVGGLTVQVNVDASRVGETGDPQKFANAIVELAVDRVVQELDFTQQRASTKVATILPGAD